MLLLLAGGQYQGRLRSLCQFHNSTDLVLEVALLEDSSDSWNYLPITAGFNSSSSSSKATIGEEVEEEVFEYERYLPLLGWSADHLKGLDPHRYSRDRTGRRGTTTFPKVPLPQVSCCCLRDCCCSPTAVQQDQTAHGLGNTLTIINCYVFIQFVTVASLKFVTIELDIPTAMSAAWHVPHEPSFQ
jgi:hypothetical protein